MADILDLGDCSTPDMMEIPITRNGERVMLKAYRNTLRCPGSTKGLVSAARRDWKEATNAGSPEYPKLDGNGAPMVDQDGNPVMTSDYEPDDMAWFRMLRNLLDAVIPDLTPREADNLSGDEDKTLDILRALDWWPKANAKPESGEGEAKGEPALTTEASSPA